MRSARANVAYRRLSTAAASSSSDDARFLWSLQPFRSTRSLGFTSNDELPVAMQQLRAEAAACIPKRRAGDFVRIAADALQMLGALPSHHRLWFDSKVAFVREPGPAAPIFNAVMAKVFNKACDHSSACEYRLTNTSAGYATSGQKGVGKSTVLRACTALAATLLPNVVSAYVDAHAHMQCINGKAPSSSPFTMLREALLARKDALLAEGIPTAMFESLSDAGDANDIACLAAQHGLVTMLAIDEMVCVYPSADIWMQLHQLATHSSTALFLADSTSRLREIVQSNSNSRSSALTKRRFGMTQPSLNDTKVAHISLPPFTERSQYSAYLSARFPSSHADTLGIDVDRLHALTGGRVRSISNVCTSIDEHKEYASPPTVPPTGSWQRFVLDRLRDLQEKAGYTSPFQMVSVPFEDIVRWRAVWQRSATASGVQQAGAASAAAARAATLADEPACGWDVVEDLIDEDVISAVYAGDEDAASPAYTFATPAQYLKLAGLTRAHRGGAATAS